MGESTTLLTMNLFSLRFPRFTGPRIMVPVAALVLAACVRLISPQDADYSNEYGSEVFQAGYGLIAERYLEPVSLHKLAASGVGSLPSLDARLSVDDSIDAFRLSYDGKPVGAVSLPAGDAPEDWSAATVRAIALARAASPAIAEAKAETIFKTVFDGIIRPLDDFSRYAGADSASEHRAMREGFGGIGLSIRMETDNGNALVISVNGDGPAATAGMQANDRVVRIDGQDIADWTQRRLIDHLRGRIGTRVLLTVLRESRPDPFDIELVRAHIVPETVRSSHEDGIAVIRILSFNRETAHKVAEAIADERAGTHEPIRGVVLDLRSNPGGLLDQAIEVADVFLDHGDIVATRGRHPRSLQRFIASADDLSGGLPLAILVNGNSASASEVVTAALQDHARGIVIGTNSFGKGTVQTVLELPNEGEITLTWSRLLTPSGYRLHELGVLPEVCTRDNGSVWIQDDLADHLRQGDHVVAGNLPVWRSTGNGDEADRSALRGLCPGDSASPDVDIAVAKAVLGDPALYKQIIQRGTDLARR